MPVAVVTDSTAYLPPGAVDGVTVVPLRVVIGGVDYLEGEESGPDDVTTALVDRHLPVTTSRPAPGQFAELYRTLLTTADAVVSVHLSAELSGTYDAAVLGAAEAAPDRISVVDARSTGMGLGFCVRAAARASAAGADRDGTAAAARAAVDATDAYFYVDTLEFLRRGGRISAASALLGTALSVKPILRLGGATGGAIVAHDKVRTTSRGLARLVDQAVAAAPEKAVEIAVHHLAAPERAAWVQDQLADRFADRLAQVWCSEVGAVVGAHAGPGLVGVVIHRSAD